MLKDKVEAVTKTVKGEDHDLLNVKIQGENLALKILSLSTKENLGGNF